MVNKYASPEGVKETLLRSLTEREQFRHNIFKGQFSEIHRIKSIEGAEQRVQSNYESGTMYNIYYIIFIYELVTQGFITLRSIN